MQSKTSPLDGVKIASPCLEPWEAMEGDERVRHCASCRLNVYNLSGMTKRQAEDLLRTHNQGRLCVRYYKRADGGVMTKDCPTGLRALRQRALKKWISASYVFALFAAGFWRIAGERIMDYAASLHRNAEEPSLAGEEGFPPSSRAYEYIGKMSAPPSKK